MSTIQPCKSIENTHDVQRGKDCMKMFCEKKMKLITNKQQKLY